LNASIRSRSSVAKIDVVAKRGFEARVTGRCERASQQVRDHQMAAWSLRETKENASIKNARRFVAAAQWVRRDQALGWVRMVASEVAQRQRIQLDQPQRQRS
jgi:hypothetical protein